MTARDFATDRTAGFPVAGEQAPADGKTRIILLWDLPLRAFHWLLVVAISVAVITGKHGGDWMSVHGTAGLGIVGLLVFRLIWGFIGPTHARFASFLPTPRRILDYLRGRWSGVGHNPLGALSVLGLLLVAAVQAGSGLFSNDDIAYTGPLNALVSEALAARMTGIHRLLVNGLLALVGLHAAAIIYHVRIKRDDLLTPMLTGHKRVVRGDSTRGGGVPAFIAAALVAGLVAYGVGSATVPRHASATNSTSASRPTW